MDPISIISLASSVAELVGTTKSVLDVIKTFKEGDKELGALSRDILALNEALINFDRILRSRHALHRISRPVLEDVLGHSRELITELEARLMQMKKSSSSAMRRTRWVQHKSSVTKLHAQLKEKNAMLHTFLTIDQSDTFNILRMSRYPDFMLSEPPEPNSQMGAEAISSSDQATRSSHLQVPWAGRRSRRGSISSSNTSDSASYLERRSILSSAASVESSTSWGSCDAIDNSSVDTADTNNMVLASTDVSGQRWKPQLSQDMFMMRQACRYNCHCRCHEELTGRPQRRFMSSGARRILCNDPVCVGNESLKDAAVEHSRSFRKALSYVMSAKSIQMRYDLKTFRMVPEGSSAMRHVKHGNLEKLKASIESGEATIWDTAPDGWTLLHTAAYNRQLPIVKYLLELGVSPSIGDIGSRTPADFAVLKSIGKDATEVEKKVMEVFSEEDDVLADFEFTPLHLVVLGLHGHDHFERPSLEELIHLVDDANNAPVTTHWTQWKLKFRGRSPLFAAILEYFRASAFEKPKGTKIIHNLIDQKDAKYHWTPLHWAASSGRVEQMRVLIEHGADPTLVSNLGANIIHAAAESKNDSGLAAALKIWRRNPELIAINQINIWGETAVHVASCLSGSCVKLLLDAGADPSVQDENGQVALHFAGLSEQSVERPKVVSILCSTEDAKHINIQDFDGRPPLFDFLDDNECVEILLQHGASVEITDNSGKNAFHHACIQGESATLQVMLGLSGSLDAVVARDASGNTPLIGALSHSHTECAMTLLKLDNIGGQIGKDGWSAIHYAARIGDPDLLEAVCQHPSFRKSAKTLDGKRASVVAMEAGTWHGKVKDIIREYDYMDWSD